jgi:hypothetical protein
LARDRSGAERHLLTDRRGSLGRNVHSLTAIQTTVNWSRGRHHKGYKMHIQNDNRTKAPDEKRAGPALTSQSVVSAIIITAITVATSDVSRELMSQGRSPLVAAMSPVVASRVSLSFGWRDIKVPPISDGEKALSRLLRPHAHFSTEIYKEEAKGMPLRQTPSASTPHLQGLSL